MLIPPPLQNISTIRGQGGGAWNAKSNISDIFSKLPKTSTFCPICIKNQIKTCLQNGERRLKARQVEPIRAKKGGLIGGGINVISTVLIFLPSPLPICFFCKNAERSTFECLHQDYGVYSDTKSKFNISVQEVYVKIGGFIIFLYIFTLFFSNPVAFFSKDLLTCIRIDLFR